MAKTPNVSWPEPYGNRIFGYFLKWEDSTREFAICRTVLGSKARIYKGNLTFEMG